MSKETKDTAPKEIKKRLEQLRKALRAENISYGELAELHSLAGYIDPSDVELLEAAGVPEFVEVGDKVEIANGANKGIVGHITTIDEDAPFHITIKTEDGHLLYGLKKNNLLAIPSDSSMAKGGKVKLKKKKPADKKKKAIDLLISNIKYNWRSTDMGSGYEFTLYAPFGTGMNQRLGDVLEKRSYLDIYDGEDDYSFEDWKSDMFQSSFDDFKERVIPEYLHFFEEHLQRDSDYSSGGSMETGGEAKKTLKKGDTIQVLGKKWFDKVNGNTYHSVAVYVNNEFVGKNDFEYGYDRQYEETGRKILEQHYNMPNGMGETDSLWRLNNYGVKVLSNACNVSRKKDLVQYEMGGTAGGSDFWSSYANDGALITGGGYSTHEKKSFGGFLLGLGLGSIGGYVYRDQITKTKEKAKWKTMEAIDRLEAGGSVYDWKNIFYEKPMSVRQSPKGRLHFDFDAGRTTGWSFDTEDVGVAAAIARGSRFLKDEKFRAIPIISAQLKETDEESVVYWLSGGNAAWRFDSQYLHDFDKTYKDLWTKKAKEIKNEIQQFRTMGELMDFYEKEYMEYPYFFDDAMGRGYTRDEYTDFREDVKRELSNISGDIDYEKTVGKNVIMIDESFDSRESAEEVAKKIVDDKLIIKKRKK